MSLGGGRFKLAPPPVPSPPPHQEGFYNALSRGEAATGEIALMQLLLLVRSREKKVDLTSWVLEVLKQQKVFDEAPSEWAPPPEWTTESSENSVCGRLRSALENWGEEELKTIARALYMLGEAVEEPSWQGVQRYLRKVKDGRLVGPPRSLNKRPLRRYVHAIVAVAAGLDCRERSALLRKVLRYRQDELPPVQGGAKSLTDYRQENRELREQNAALRVSVHALRKQGAYWQREAEVAREAERMRLTTIRKEESNKLKAVRKYKVGDIRKAEEACAEARWKGKMTLLANKRKAAVTEAKEAKAVASKAENALVYHKRVSAKRLEKMNGMKESITVLQAENEELFDVRNELKEKTDELKKWEAREKLVPTWRPVVGKGAGRGGQKMEWETRVIILSMLAMACPPAIVAPIIVAIVKRTAPWLNPVLPTTRTIRDMRFGLRLLKETLAGRRIAAAHRVRQLGFDETTKFQDPSMVTSVLIVPDPGAKPQVVVMRAAYATGGGTSEHLVQAIEEKCFARARKFLVGWEETCKRMYPNHKWTGPKAERCGLQALGAGGAIQSDTCTAARCTKRLLAAEIAGQVSAKHPDWGSLSEQDQEAAVRVQCQDCFHHIRNIFLNAMSKAQSAYVKDTLAQQLEAFASWERMDTDFDNLLRACYKEFHHGGRYYKGKGKEFLEWMRDHHPDAFVMHLERAEGGRQDLDFDAAIPMYINRKYMWEFLETKVNTQGHKNILEDFLFIALGTNEYVAMIRANALIDLLVARPMRWLTGKSAGLVDWSPYCMGPVLESVEALLELGAADGSVFLDPARYDPDNNLYLFKSVVDTQPEFRAHLDYMLNKDTVLSLDGSKRHLQFQEALAELLNPQDATNAATRAKTIEYLQVQYKAGLAKLHDKRTVIPEYLTSQDGAKSWGKVAQAHADTKGTEADNNKFSESVFGTFDRMLKIFFGITREAASSLAQAIRAKSFWMGDAVRHRKPKEEPEGHEAFGYFHSLPLEEQESLVEYVRIINRQQHKVDAEHNAEVAAYVKSKVRTNSQEELQTLLTEWGYGMSFFDQWQERGVRSNREITSALHKIDQENAKEKSSRRLQLKLDWLRNQIEMRTRGLRWTDFGTKWSSILDDEVGTIEDLTSVLKEILEEERRCRAAGTLPEVAPAPTMKRKTFKELGSPTAQADALSERHDAFSEGEYREKAEAERRRLELAGEIDWIGDMQPTKAPAFASLVGKQLEIRWRYWVKDSSMKSGRRSEYIWCAGEVIEVDQAKVPKSLIPEKVKKDPNMKWGGVRIKWPADDDRGEKEGFIWSVLLEFIWSVLLEKNWCAETHLGWRYAESELVKIRANKKRP